MSAQEPAQWAFDAARQIHPEYSSEWFINAAKSNESYRRLYEEAEAYRMELARKIEAASPVKKLEDANARLVSEWERFTEDLRSPVSMLIAEESANRLNVAKHTPKQ